MEVEYKIVFKKLGVNFTDNQLTLLINHIKSRVLSTVYFKFKLFDSDDELIYTYVSDRWVVSNTYSHKWRTFEVNESKLSDAVQYQIELYATGISSENPLYFNQMMLKSGEVSEYHKPNDIIEKVDIDFNKSSYVNLYGTGDNYLQVIRPKHDKFNTKELTASECTVLVPHIKDESRFDDPIDVFLEFINQTEQRIDVLR